MKFSSLTFFLLSNLNARAKEDKIFQEFFFLFVKRSFFFFQSIVGVIVEKRINEGKEKK